MASKNEKNTSLTGKVFQGTVLVALAVLHVACGGPGECEGVVCSAGQACVAGGQCKNDDATLSALSLAEAALSPSFASSTIGYTAPVSMCVPAVTVTAMATDPDAQLLINGSSAGAGTGSARVALALGADTVTVEVVAPSGRRGAYTLRVLTEGSTYVKASNTGAYDRFGAKVAISTSGATMAISAITENSSATGINGDQSDDSASHAGAVYVFARSGETWTQQAYIKASNTDPEDRFGYAVALSEDGNTLAVGAPDEGSTAQGVNGDQSSNGSARSGAAYVFARSDGVWTQQAYIKASDPDSGDWFGMTVALSGNTLAVGTPRESSCATGVDGTQSNNDCQGSGAVYVFTRSGATWAQQAYIKASNTDEYDEFGSSLALASEGDMLAVGAINESSSAAGIDGDQTDNGAEGSGAVYIFTRSGPTPTWTQQAYVKASNPGALDRFGQSVSLARTGDTIAVGAFQEESSATGMNGNQGDNSVREAGAVYVFTRSEAGWSQQAYLKPSNTGLGDNFGLSVSLSPAGDAVAVGAVGEASNSAGPGANQADNSALASGAVYLFGRSGGTWAQRAYLKASNPGVGDMFGIDVALASGTLLVGAHNESSDATGIGGTQATDGAPSSGAAYVYVCQ